MSLDAIPSPGQLPGSGSTLRCATSMANSRRSSPSRAVTRACVRTRARPSRTASPRTGASPRHPARLQHVAGRLGRPHPVRRGSRRRRWDRSFCAHRVSDSHPGAGPAAAGHGQVQVAAVRHSCERLGDAPAVRLGVDASVRELAHYAVHRVPARRGACSHGGRTDDRKEDPAVMACSSASGRAQTARTPGVAPTLHRAPEVCHRAARTRSAWWPAVHRRLAAGVPRLLSPRLPATACRSLRAVRAAGR